MDNYKKEGKNFLAVVIIIAIFSIYVSINGFHNNNLTGSQWIIILGTLFTSTVNLLKNRKIHESCYTIGNFIIVVTLVVCYIVPQLIRLINN